MPVNPAIAKRPSHVHVTVSADTASQLNQLSKLMSAYDLEGDWSQGAIVDIALKEYLPKLNKKFNQLLNPPNKTEPVFPKKKTAAARGAKK